MAAMRRISATRAATWVDEEVLVEDGLVTGREPDDIPALRQAIEEFGEGRARGDAPARRGRAPERHRRRGGNSPLRPEDMPPAR